MHCPLWRVMLHDNINMINQRILLLLSLKNIIFAQIYSKSA